MRPRVFPAEDLSSRLHRLFAAGASMRPRVFPAEDSLDAGREFVAAGGFNEAAGIPRGRLEMAEAGNLAEGLQ